MSSVRLSDIVTTADTQVRAAINEQTVTAYAERMTEGDIFPPVVLFHDGNAHYLADGFHRVMAAQRVECRDIPADVRKGTREDALWFALGANRANGQRLTEQDKRHALTLAIQAFPDRSMRQLADHVGCSSTYASRIRDEVQTSLQPVQRVTGADGRSYPASHAVRDITRENAALMFKEGKSVADVRAATGIGRDAAQQLRKDIGLGVDKSRAAITQRRQDIRDMAERGFTTRQIAASVGIAEQTVGEIAKTEGIVVHADRVVGKTKRHDSNRIAAQIVADAENLTEGTELIDFSELTRSEIPGWLKSLQDSREKLGGFIRRLMKEQQHGEAA